MFRVRNLVNTTTTPGKPRAVLASPSSALARRVMSADSVRIPTPAGGDGAAEADPDSPPALSRRLTSGMTLQAVPG
eukprot:scaffold92742_cov46-Phaeocystis_antarctica.AAC.1